MTDRDDDYHADAASDRACDDWRYQPPSKALPLTLEVPEAETATSLCSRLSAINGLPRMRGLCRDFGINHADLSNGETKAVTRIAELAGTDPQAMLFHTPRLVEPGRLRLGREQLKFTAMLRNGGQICPLCIAEDDCRDQHFGPYQRDIWQVAAFRRCHIHGVAFERPQFSCRHSEVHDFLQSLKSWVPAKIVHVGLEDLELENNLLQRIRNGPENSWINGLAFHVVWLFSEAMGLLLTRGPKAKLHEQDTSVLIRAGAVGFVVLRSGPEGLQWVLTNIMDEAGPDRNNYGKIYAPLLTCLVERRRDPDFNDLRRFARSFILQNFRVPPGTSILGGLQQPGERRTNRTVLHDRSYQFRRRPFALPPLQIDRKGALDPVLRILRGPIGGLFKQFAGQDVRMLLRNRALLDLRSLRPVAEITSTPLHEVAHHPCTGIVR